MKKLIIWDFDGPIVDSRHMAFELTQHQYEDITEDIHRNLFNGNIFTELAKLKKKNVTEEEHTTFLEKNYWPRKIELIPVEGIREIISELSQDFIMVINSSSATLQISNYLEKNNLLHFFKKIYGNEIKSKEEKFKLILEYFEVSPNNCVLITDTLGDVLEANILNIPSVVVLWGYQLKEHFNSIKDKIIFVEQPSELIGAIKSHFSI